MFRIEKRGHVLPDAEIRETPNKGRGVFAKRKYEKGELIERAPTITCDVSLIEELYRLNDHRTILHDYVFTYNGIAHVGLGWSSIYNHSSDNNAHWKVFNETSSVEVRARKDILAGEEITIRYTNYNSMLWFEPSEDKDVAPSDDVDLHPSGE